VLIFEVVLVCNRFLMRNLGLRFIAQIAMESFLWFCANFSYF